jgi:hypothetical protein
VEDQRAGLKPWAADIDLPSIRPIKQGPPVGRGGVATDSDTGYRAGRYGPVIGIVLNSLMDQAFPAPAHTAQRAAFGLGQLW